ncbi:MAG TPA: PAS domain S-box protein [Steroidobacteraceae bacterium]|nr:PAS domain S-box protein [Steroidobacteraceae bacterium]
MKTAPPDLARSALDAAPDAMIIIDGSGAIRFVNRQVSSLFGYAHDEIVNQPVELLLPERFRARHVGHRENYWSSVRVRPMGAGLELFGRRKDGSEFPVEISLSPIEHEQHTLVAAAIRDVTARKRAEAELIRAREAADQARELAIEAREAADRANHGKSRFLATASHDLRQPLQTLELLNGSLRRLQVSDAVAQAVAQQGVAIGAMSRLLNALLDISKLESGAVRPDPADFAVRALFEELRREFETSAASKGLQFQVSAGEEYAHSDPSLVEQVLRNLVSNAIKYTQRGRVALKCAVSPDSMLKLEVLDTGIGIPAAQIQYIYDEFYQVGVPANSTRDGYGLGLSIVQRIVKLLNLRLEVRSEVGQGSVFSLAVPASSAREPRSRATQAQPQVARQPIGAPRVLLVEDDRSVRDATRLLLSVEGYQVTGVATLSEALEHAARHTIDLLVTDYHLANGETGTAVISALRESLGTHLKSVLITGDTSAAVQELPRDPFMRITSKPVQADELLTLMRALLAA